MRYRVRHVTTYEYGESVSICHNEARLAPLSTRTQRPLASRIQVEPAAAVLVEDRDYFGNTVHFFSLEEAHLKLTVTADAEVELSPIETPDLSRSPPWEHVRARALRDRDPEALRALEFSLEPPGERRLPELVLYAKQSLLPGRPLLEAVFDLTRRIHADFRYLPGSTHVGTALEEVFATRQGVCQDFAHLELAALRAFGIPACYVSGYVYNAPASCEPRRSGADASHAWISVWCPELGYVDFDPTNGSVPRDEHITLARGRDYSDVSPLRGVILGGGRQVVQVAVDVQRV
ncbi:MAG TPA: transglutaminase family protein [Polyangiaceae bacterium]|nr:transglutaminase family protein [Polyangiaceae bacterium]